MRRKEMSDKEKTFVREYLTNGKNAKEAFKVSHAKNHMSPASLGVKSRNYLRKNKNVVAALDAAEKKAMVKVGNAMEKYGITVERIADELAKIAFSDIRDTAEWDENGLRVKPSKDLTDSAAGAVMEVSEQKGLHGSQMRIKNYDKQRALVDLGKALGMFQEEVQKGPQMAVQFLIQKD